MIPIINESNFIQQLKLQKKSSLEKYFALYSSWLGGITTNPHLMLLPIDDHMVHRGDGVFEAIKVVNRSAYFLDRHLERLFISAKTISLFPSFNIEHVRNIIIETLRVANQNDAMIRVFISRGPGNFSVNPYDPTEAQLYVMICSLKSLSSEKYLEGVVIGKSQVPIKPSWMNQVKSCNYLQNALMKKEAVDRDLDFVIGVDADGCVTEGPTENIMLITNDNTIIHPPLNTILSGITMTRVCELAHEMNLKVEARTITSNDLSSATEVFMTGTTINVLPVVKFENDTIGDGKPGPIAKKLNKLITSEIDSALQGVIF